MQRDRGRKLLAPWGPYLKIYAPSRRPDRNVDCSSVHTRSKCCLRREDVTGNEAASVLWTAWRRRGTVRRGCGAGLKYFVRGHTALTKKFYLHTHVHQRPVISTQNITFSESTKWVAIPALCTSLPFSLNPVSARK